MNQTTNQNDWPFGLTTRIPDRSKESQLVRDIIAMEKELDELRNQVGQINATLEVNYGMHGRKQDGLMINSKGLSPFMFMVAVLREYASLLRIAQTKADRANGIDSEIRPSETHGSETGSPLA